LVDAPNTVSEDLGFINIHYYAAAASIYGSEVMGGYQFEGQSYQMRNRHVEGFDTCAGCHDPHTLELQVNDCAGCHEGVESVEDLHEIRSVGSAVDYDGDGDKEEGIFGEIETLQEMLYTAIQIYGSEVVGSPIVYDEHAYPYFFNDSDGDGELTEGEASFPNAYSAFTPIMLQVTYNYQVSKKDPGNYAHNPDYHIQLLYDSIAAINEQLAEGVDLSTASRDSFGHFNASAEAFRHWDEDGEVDATCSKCHSADGLPFFLEHDTLINQEVSNSLNCTTCHSDLAEGTLYSVPSVVFPSGAEVSFSDDPEDPSPNNICMSCHQGRESGVGIAQAIADAGVGDDEVSPDLRFRNPHYFATGATLFGTEVTGAYEYADSEYNGRNEHTRRFNECSDCHEQHAAEIRFEECSDCHENVETLADVQLIRAHPDDKDPVDYDGDGDDEEPIAAEIETLHTALFDAISAYAADTIGTPIAQGSSYPYWFTDGNANGMVDEDEASRDNAYGEWTPTLLRAIYNYQFFAADPGNFAHNPDYVLQVLYDTLSDIAGEDAVANYTRPEVRELDD
jgi:Zn finger protein HypA/HybF involved in hydrogenase expression